MRGGELSRQAVAETTSAVVGSDALEARIAFESPCAARDMIFH
jgi:hypothetical protein